MLVVNYNENRPTTDYFKFSVKGNNDADIVRFIVEKQHESLDLADGYNVYVKCKNGYGFVDKVLISEENIEFNENEIIVDWHLLRKHTQNESLIVSLCFENNENEVVWQTQTFTLKIANGIIADDEIENKYPTILQQMQAEIDELKKSKGGGSNEVEIKRVYLTYDDKKSIRSDYLGLYDSDNDDKPFTNDSTRIWYNFETTPISTTIEEEIKKGRFVIRLDYPLKNRMRFHKNNEIINSITRKNGVGTRGYTHNFLGGQGALNNLKKAMLLNSLIFITEDDIKVNRYGEKYIHKKVSFFNYINNMCCFNSRLQGLEPITNEWIKSGDGNLFFEDYLANIYGEGIPHLYEPASEVDCQFIGTARNKFFNGIQSDYSASAGVHKDEGDLKTNSVKLNPAFACYCCLKLALYENIKLNSPYFLGIKGCNFRLFANTYLVMSRHNNDGVPAGKRVTKKAYMSARPRCAILNDNYETADYAFLKTFKQSDQQIKLYCKAVGDVDAYGVMFMPIFRTLITQK